MNWFNDNKMNLLIGTIGSLIATFITTDLMPEILHSWGIQSDLAPIWAKLAIYSAAIAIPIALVFVLPKMVTWAALLSVIFLAFGFRSWARRNSEVQPKDLWSWVADQMLVAQGRHAFSVECIGFTGAIDHPKVVLLSRSFPGFKKPVYLWPGGRLRGVEVDLGEEARGVFKRETGCTVTLIPSASHDGEQLTSIDGKGREIVNKYSPTPFLVMHQNRPQKHGVPGHVALIYVGILADSSNKVTDVRIVDLDRIRKTDDLHPEELWKDTARTILLAYERWRLHSQSQH